MADIVLKLADCLKKRLAFDVADSTAYLDDGDLCFVGCVCIVAIEAALDFVCDVRDNLYGAAAVVAAAFFLKNGPVNLSGGNVGIFGETFINETLIMAKVKVGFCAVIGDEYLAVLDRIHGSRVDVDVRVKFLHGYLIAACFEQTAQRCCGDTLSKSGNDTACYENVFYWHGFPPVLLCVMCVIVIGKAGISDPLF